MKNMFTYRDDIYKIINDNTTVSSTAGNLIAHKTAEYIVNEVNRTTKEALAEQEKKRQMTAGAARCGNSSDPIGEIRGEIPRAIAGGAGGMVQGSMAGNQQQDVQKAIAKDHTSPADRYALYANVLFGAGVKHMSPDLFQAIDQIHVMLNHWEK